MKSLAYRLGEKSAGMGGVLKAVAGAPARLGRAMGSGAARVQNRATLHADARQPDHNPLAALSSGFKMPARAPRYKPGYRTPNETADAEILGSKAPGRYDGKDMKLTSN